MGRARRSRRCRPSAPPLRADQGQVGSRDNEDLVVHPQFVGRCHRRPLPRGRVRDSARPGAETETTGCSTTSPPAPTGTRPAAPSNRTFQRRPRRAPGAGGWRPPRPQPLTRPAPTDPPALPTGSAAGPAAQSDPATPIDQPAQPGRAGAHGPGRRSAAAATDGRRTGEGPAQARAAQATAVAGSGGGRGSLPVRRPARAGPGSRVARRAHGCGAGPTAGESPAPAKRTRARRSATRPADRPSRAEPDRRRRSRRAPGTPTAAAGRRRGGGRGRAWPRPATRLRRSGPDPAGWRRRRPALRPHVESAEPTMALPAVCGRPAGRRGAGSRACAGGDHRRSAAAAPGPRRPLTGRARIARHARRRRGRSARRRGTAAAARGLPRATRPQNHRSRTSRSVPSSASPFTDAPAEPTRRTRRRATAPETSPPPAAVMFVAPTETEAAGPRRRTRAAEAAGPAGRGGRGDRRAETQPRRRRRTRAADEQPAPEPEETQPRRRRRTRAAGEQPAPEPEETEPDETEERRTTTTRTTTGGGAAAGAVAAVAVAAGAVPTARPRRPRRPTDEAAEHEAPTRPTPRTRTTRRTATAVVPPPPSAAPPRWRRCDADQAPTTTRRTPWCRSASRGRQASGRRRTTRCRASRGSTRLEAKRQRRRDGREQRRRRPPILTESEFLARREAVDRVMVVRQRGDRTQIAVLEDGVLVEHYVTRASVRRRTPATSTSARCRTCCPAWRRRSSTSAGAATPCSTPARSTGTPPGWRAGPARSSRR